MNVLQKIALKRKELGLADQPRKKTGEFKRKERDVFLLWGEYPKGWQMIKDMILCLMLLSALIGHLKELDYSQLLAEDTASAVQIPVVQAEEVAPEVKTSEIAKSEATEASKVGEFTAYNSEISQTDADPFTMASGKKVYDGAIANNCLPFGTKVKVNGKVKIVDDRMNSRYGCEHFDIWMASYDQAVNFGRQMISYEIL